MPRPYQDHLKFGTLWFLMVLHGTVQQVVDPIKRLFLYFFVRCFIMLRLSALTAASLSQLAFVKSQAKDSRKTIVEQNEFAEELSEQEGRLLL
jgi:hypothetical protein